MKADDLGSYFIDKDGQVWEMTTYCEHPTCGLKNVVTGERISVVPFSLHAQNWTKLIPESTPNDSYTKVTK